MQARFGTASHPIHPHTNTHAPSSACVKVAWDDHNWRHMPAYVVAQQAVAARPTSATIDGEHYSSDPDNYMAMCSAAVRFLMGDEAA